MERTNTLNTVQKEGELLRINGVLLNHSQTDEYIKLRDRVNESIVDLDNKYPYPAYSVDMAHPLNITAPAIKGEEDK